MSKNLPSINPDIEMVATIVKRSLSFPLRSKAYSDAGKKTTEGSHNTRGIMLWPEKSRSSAIWGTKARQAFYAVQVADRSPEFWPDDNKLAAIEVGFCFRPGPDNDSYEPILHILSNFARVKNSEVPGWCFVVPRGHVLVNGTTWKFLHLLKRFGQYEHGIVAHDLCTIIEGTVGAVSRA